MLSIGIRLLCFTGDFGFLLLLLLSVIKPVVGAGAFDLDWVFGFDCFCGHFCTSLYAFDATARKSIGNRFGFHVLVLIQFTSDTHCAD